MFLCKLNEFEITNPNITDLTNLHGTQNKDLASKVTTNMLPNIAANVIKRIVKCEKLKEFQKENVETRDWLYLFYFLFIQYL